MNMTRPPEENRPSPEALLKLARAEENRSTQGRLKIFLGYAAGVGKTYAMLEAARRHKQEGRDVVAAYVESHGRPETDALLEGLDVVPRLRIAYQGFALSEMDLDAVLARNPRIALVDELAHTNAPGLRHPKRWQDVEELLAAGIDVFTTVNVQHLESLADAVARITGVTIRESVPDLLLDQADEIRVVDIPPEDLLQRLREGKVYVPEQAAWAVEKFFKPGNLMALREMALRRAAARVDEQMRDYMEARAIPGPWPAGERLLVGVGGSPYSEKLIRAARRLADELRAPWVTVYIETPGEDKYSRENREQVWRHLRLAESLGAEVATLTADSAPEALIEFAARRNVTKIVVGKPVKPRWRKWLKPSIFDRIVQLSGDMDVLVVRFTPEVQKSLPAGKKVKTSLRLSDCAVALALTAAASLIGALARPFLNPTNLVMVYLLAVVLAAARFGQKPAVFTALFGVLAFDFFFVPPAFTFAVADAEYLITFAALFVVGVVIGALVSKARQRADALRNREIRTASLYNLSRDLSGAPDLSVVMKVVVRNIEESFQAKAAFFLPEGEALNVAAASETLSLDLKEKAVADWSFRNRRPAGRGTDMLSSADLMYLPLQTTATLGVLGVSLFKSEDYHSEDHRRMLDAYASQTALAMERIRLARQAEQARLFQARENLERALLNSVSHDLRSPLVAITGVLGGLREEPDALTGQARRDLVESAWQEAERLNRFVGNLLDMTRLEAGAMHLKLEPSDPQDLIGCALGALEKQLAGRPVEVEIPSGLPLIPLDMALMTQVLVNLLDNALKYSPYGSPIEVAARIAESRLIIHVADRGPGLPESELGSVFDKFHRVSVPEGPRGVGLGLSICKGIVEAHGGTVHAENRSGGGLRVVLDLPLDPSPGMVK